jgi:hypothetical protein
VVHLHASVSSVGNMNIVVTIRADSVWCTKLILTAAVRSHRLQPFASRRYFHNARVTVAVRYVDIAFGIPSNIGWTVEPADSSHRMDRFGIVPHPFIRCARMFKVGLFIPLPYPIYSYLLACLAKKSSEAGCDMSKWEDEDHFVSWLRLCPDNRISGNKVLGKGRLPTNNRASIALRMAASTLRLSNTYLGAQFRRFSTKLGAPVAIKAMAAKLARLVYRMLRYGMKYVDQGAKIYEAQHRQRQIGQLKWNAAKLGFRVVEVAA